MSGKRDIRREWTDHVTSLAQDRDLGNVVRNPFGEGVPETWDSDLTEWTVDPIIARPGGRIEALRLDDE